MSVFGPDKEMELHSRLTAFIHGDADDDENFGDPGMNAPGSPDRFSEAPGSPGPSDIAMAFAAGAHSPALSRPVSLRSLSLRPRHTRAPPEITAGGDKDNDGWTSSESGASRAGSPAPGVDARGGGGGTRRGAAVGGRSAIDRTQARGLNAENSQPGEEEEGANPVMHYRCWACCDIVSIRRKEVSVICPGCGGRIVMKVRPELTVTYSTM
ncbi:hypothetical protein L873DRAFT_1839912 [Choiromyces venosus 120613-1]|uniref:Uncharacterized protein n=1 Tax=Choiromyces venosus 120613-1 TaxID=1336337 RepID=A0A3N4K449_9PEZI|nr:hypothetical protein L873DRAFT_1839912 [Choiromyces venosus 120613-1]